MEKKRYQRLSVSELKEIQTLSKNGKSIRYIAKKLGLRNTTVYYHVRKKQGLKQRKPDFNVWTTIEIGEIMGAFAGDGSFFHYKSGRCSHYNCRFHFNIKEEEYTNKLVDILKRSGLNVFKYTIENYNNTDVKVNSKGFIDFIKEHLSWDGKKTYSVHLKTKYFDDKDFLIGFLIGLMRSDGHVSRYHINFASTSPKLAKNMCDIMDMLKIEYKLSERVHKSKNRKNLFQIRVPARARPQFYEFCNMGLLGFPNESEFENPSRL